MENSLQADEVFVFMSIGIAIMLLLALAFVLFFYFSQRKFHSEQLKTQQLQLEHQEQLLYGTIQAQEVERKRIAKDLHDDIGSKLNVLFLNMHRLGENESQQEIVKEMNHLINTTIETTRRISHDLLPPTLESFGLQEALKELAENYRKTQQIEMQVDIHGQPSSPLAKQTALNLFRVTQELVRNSIQHGEATTLSLHLWFGSDQLKLQYTDDGKGFDLTDENFQHGLGMKNIESRLNMIHAQSHWQSSPGAGVQFTLHYPLPT